MCIVGFESDQRTTAAVINKNMTQNATIKTNIIHIGTV